MCCKIWLNLKVGVNLMKREITFAAVGDLMLGDHPVRFGNGVRSRIEKDGTEYLFSKTKPLWEGSDIVFGNVEAILSDIGLNKARLDSAEFRGSPESIPALKKVGFNVLNLSNNHCMEYGLDAFWETVNLLRKQGIFVTGLRSDVGGCIPYELEKNGVKATLLSYSLCCENYYKGNEVPYTFATEEKILQEVALYRDRSDVLIVSLHWGEEYMSYPSPQQVVFAHRLVDHGVDLILGHHPHVLQGVEKYKNAVIAYSLGNFIFDMWQRPTRQSIILKGTFSKDGISEVEMIPLYINDRFQPEILDKRLHPEFLQSMERLGSMISEKYAHIETHLPSLEADYLKQAHKKVLFNRFENYFFFLSHIYQYSSDVIFQSMARFFKRRVEEVQTVVGER